MLAAALGRDDLSSHSSGRRSWRSSSLREIWNEPDVFRRSRHEVDHDEEELKWAAIERLPTYDRTRKSMLKKVLGNGRVVQNEVDVTNLGDQEKKELIENVLRIVEEDNEKFLMRIRCRIDRF